MLTDRVSAYTFGFGCLYLGGRRSTREAQKSPVWALHCSASMGITQIELQEVKLLLYINAVSNKQLYRTVFIQINGPKTSNFHQ